MSLSFHLFGICSSVARLLEVTAINFFSGQEQRLEPKEIVFEYRERKQAEKMEKVTLARRGGRDKRVEEKGKENLWWSVIYRREIK